MEKTLKLAYAIFWKPLIKNRLKMTDFHLTIVLETS